ncbi:TIGR03618 family F420-dependent PPOX class oxidoreductase [Nakamurella sp. YIM 132087]|uniref:TIGR03618 family F420-dependent PPOX class oxidoreductase n=1 Tax=Nakamurella alba TaxID=2665158 RepID=A0A7K1FL31_9ACTN|nr:TIGR03618 family F420-dependent PPOX class oxidoreductase [Nakamurella alba]MTD14818.1 TIGR03618 family F420-dependent PPOX class oxidoreductase [Nakamurella alba]
MPIPDSLRTLVESGPLAHLTTLNASGSPQVTVIWIGLDADDPDVLVSGHMAANLKVRNMIRDPRTVLSFDAPRTPGVFLAEHAVLTTTATVTEGGAWGLLDRLAKVYISPDATFPAPRAEGGFVIRYRIDKIAGVGPWTG